MTYDIELLNAAEGALKDCADLIGTEAGERLKMAVHYFKKEVANASVFPTSTSGRGTLGRRPVDNWSDLPDGLIRGVFDLGIIVESDARFLSWLADRLVFVYKENPNIDFVLATRRISENLGAAIVHSRLTNL